MTLPKPEPVEMAEEFASTVASSVWDGMRADVDLSALQQYERLAVLIAARDAALVADAEARGALKALDELEARACGTPDCSCWRNAVLPFLRERYTKGGADGG